MIVPYFKSLCLEIAVGGERAASRSQFYHCRPGKPGSFGLMSFRVCYLSWKLNLSPSPGNVKSVTTLRDERFPIGFNRDDLLILCGRRRGRKYLPIRSILRYNNDDKIGIRRYRILKNFEEFRRGSGTYAIKPDRGDRRHDFSVKREV